MITRYSTPEMSEVWSDEARINRWLAVEKVVAEVMEDREIIPPGISARFPKQILPSTVAFEETRTKHDFVAFLNVLRNAVGRPESRWVHFGLTSSDIIDTALSLTLRRSSVILTGRIMELLDDLDDLIRKHKETLMAGRTHGVYAEPITFGFRMAAWSAAIFRASEMIEFTEPGTGMISGSVGTHANVSRDVERDVCDRLQLAPEHFSTQIIPRDRHANVILALASYGAVLEKASLDLRLMASRGEIAESFGPEQVGSSSMPHKRNPIGFENICGVARLLRSYTMPALENVAVWDERDISHSSVERVILPDAFQLADYATRRFSNLIRTLKVDSRVMEDGINCSLNCQGLVLELVRAGYGRREAERMVRDLDSGSLKSDVVIKATGIDRHFVAIRKELSGY